MATIPPEARVLNAEQQKAVEYGAGPLMIIAGAGTGKTTVVTERIKHLITSGKALPQEILALTFTEKAAREMEERTDQILPYGYTQMWISTFHKFCDRILRSEAIHIGLNPAYKLLTEADATMLLRKHLFSFNLDYFRPLGNPTKFIGGMLQHFSRLKDEDVAPNQYINWVKSKIRNPKSETNSKLKIQKEEKELEHKKYLELAHAYEAYEELKIKEGVMDFSDLISNALRLFRQRPNVLREYQERFKYMLVDEFQDTNIAQNELIVLLAKNKNITVVLDDDQSIYKFRGAAVSNVFAFRKYFPKAKLIVLTQNYRSTQEILDASYQLITNNNPDRLEAKEGINKKLTAVRKLAGDPPKLLYLDRVENEAEAVVKILNAKCQMLNGKRQYDWKDVAILVRANNHAEPFVRALTRHGIPYQFLGPGQLFRQPEVKDLIAYLKVLDNFEDNVSFFRVLSMEYFGLDARDLAALSNYAKKQNLSIFESCEDFSRMDSNNENSNKPELRKPTLTGHTQKTITKIIQMIHRHLGLVTKESGGQLLFYFLEDSGMMKSILENKVPFDEHRAANVSKFFSKLKTYEVEHEDASVATILDWITLAMELGESPIAGDTDWSQNNAVNILTIHSAKGLEFPVVFLVNLVSQRFPTIERHEQIPIPEALIKEELPEGDYHLEEERRLFYVGMTRARDALYITAANFYGEGKREKKLSPFIAEVFGRNEVQTAEQADPQLSLLDWKSTPARGEADKKNTPLSVTYLSYSQIETFRLCPLHYKLRYLLGVPTPPTPALSFGSSMHAVMRQAYERVMSHETVDNKTFLELLEKSWIRQGYTSKSYEEQMKKRGQGYLEAYAQKEFSDKTSPIVLEQPFSVPISTGNRKLTIGGKIDRIDALSDGTIEIIDYKTGRIPSKREADDNLQLSMYAIAASEIPGTPFFRSADKMTLTLYYFDTQEKISTARTKKQLDAEKARIIDVAREIESSDFRCSGNQLCATCEYQMFCDTKG